MKVSFAPDKVGSTGLLVTPRFGYGRAVSLLAAFLLVSMAAMAENPTTAPSKPAVVAPDASSAGGGLESLQIEWLTDKADRIVRAEVSGKSAAFVDGHVETTYNLNVLENFKGDGAATLEVTTLGGAVPGFPMYQMVRDMPTMYQNEEVVLFLKTDVQSDIQAINARRQAAGMKAMEFSAGSKLLSSPRIVGKAKGKFSVLTMDDGRKLLRRYRPIASIADDQAIMAMADADLQNLARRMTRPGTKPMKVDNSARTAPTAAIAAEVAKHAAPKAVSPLDGKIDAAMQGPDVTTKQQLIEAGTYRPSSVTDPKAVAAESAALKNNRRVIPANMDGFAAPVTLEVFRTLVARRVQDPTTTAPALGQPEIR